MAQRQGRRSLGLPPLAPPPLPEKRETGLIDAQKFDDFRRRHREQNKDIIIDNVDRKKTIKLLQDEIAFLQGELLDVRQSNLSLKAKVKRMERDNGRIGGQAVLEALDHLLAAAPALVSLRESLASLPRQPPKAASTAKPPVLSLVGNPTATNPAARGRQRHGLGAVMEGHGSEEDEDGEWIDGRKVAWKSRGRRTDVGSIAASRSPRPKTPVSPSRSSVSPSPKKIQVPSARKFTHVKRRRESALLPPRPRSTSPEDAVSIPRKAEPTEKGKEKMVVDEAVGEVQEEDGVGESSEWDEGVVVEMKPDEAMALVEEAVEEEEEEQEALPAVKPPSKGKGKAVALDSAAEIVEPEGGSEPSRASSSSAPSSDSAAEGAGRGRRARGSVVSYKEPSLVKKMRKPDGIQAEEILKPVSRKSITPKKSKVSRRSSSPPPVPDFSLTASGRGGPSRSTSSQSASLASTSQSMRRKSTLPKTGAVGRRASPASPVGKGKEVDTEGGAGDLVEESDAGLDVEFGRSLHIGSSSVSRAGSSATATSATRPASGGTRPQRPPTPAGSMASHSASSLVSALGVGAHPASAATGSGAARRPTGGRSFTPTSGAGARPRDVLGEVARHGNVDAKGEERERERGEKTAGGGGARRASTAV
ncbi:hypothetical protein IAT38_005674 [Cryptococcus sp. DSM 104549]